MGSKGTQTTTQTSSPNPTALASYYNLINQAGNVASTPYQPYTGEGVAPINPQQYGGIGTINQYATAGIPGLQTAENTFASSAGPLTPGQIASYENPYTQQVVGATQHQFDILNAEQQNSLLSNLASQGALGGTGGTVAQSVLAGQQAAQEAPTIAGEEAAGYNTAVQTAAQQYQQNPQAAAFGQANAATALENAGLTGGNAEVGAGSLEQQTQQAADTYAFQQYLAQLAYPFQTTQWLAGIDTGVGSQMGGTSSTTGPAPSWLSQLTGGLLGGVGVLGGTGAFGSNGWMSGMFSGAGGAASGAMAGADPLAMLAMANRGGRIKQRAQGGIVPHFAGGGSTMYPQFGGGYGVATMPYAGGQSSVPGIGITHGHGPPAPPRPVNPDQSSQQMWQNAAKLAGNFRSNTQGGIGPIGTSPEAAQVVDAPAGTLVSDNAIYQKGGRVIPFRREGGRTTPIRAGMGLASFVPHFADGGEAAPVSLYVSDPQAMNDAFTAVADQGSPNDLLGNWIPGRITYDKVFNAGLHRMFGPNAQVIPTAESSRGYAVGGVAPHFADGGANDNETIIPETIAPAQAVNQRWASPPVPASWYGSDPTPNILALEAYGQLSPMNPAAGLAPPVDAGEGAAPANGTPQGAPPPPMGGVGPAMGYAPQDGGQPVAAMPPAGGPPMNAAPAAGVASQQDRWGAGADIWPTLIAAGAGMLSSGSPFPGVGIGRGLQAGLGEMGALQQAHLQQQKEAREERTSQQDIDIKVRQLNQQAKAEQDRLGMEAKQLAETSRYHSAELSKPFAVGTDLNTGMPIYAVRDPNAPNGVRRIDLTGEPQPGAGAPQGGATAQAQPGAQLPATSAPTSLDTPSGVHPDVLGALNPQMAAQVKALDEGRMQFPSGFALKSPYWQNMLRVVAEYDPSFDAVNYNARAKARADFTSGKSAQNITSFNTAIGHLDTLDKSIDALGNTRFGWLNPVLQTGKSAMGDTQYQEAQKRFAAARQAVTDELTRAFRGSGGNVHDIVGWEQTLNQADSPQAMHAAVKAAVDLLRSRIESVGDQYNRGMGTTRDPLTMLSPHAAATVKRLQTGDETQQQFTGRTATNPQNGQKLRETVDGQWVQ